MDILKKLAKILAVLIITFAWMAATCGGSYTVLLNFAPNKSVWVAMMVMTWAALITIPVWITILYWSTKLLFSRKK